MEGQFDIIVIGSGLGGLECGAMLAREGMGVCVAEQAALPGGLSLIHIYEPTRP